MDILSLLMRIAQFGSDSWKGRTQAEREKIERLANFFEQISKCLEGTADAIRKGKSPGKYCAELSEYLRGLKNLIGKRMSEADVTRLDKYLRVAYIMPGAVVYERELGADLAPVRGTIRDRKKRADKIDEVGAYFKATANKLKARS